MKKITDFATLENNDVTKQEKIIIKHYLQELFDLYDIDTIKDIGSIYVLENKMELLDYKSFEIYEPISVDNIEFVDKIFSSSINTQEPLFILACFLISTDYAIYLLLPETILSAEYKSIFEQANFINNKYFDLEE
jgi:hypothetical protein